MLLGCCVDPSRLPFVIPAGFDYAELPVRTVLPDQPDSVWQTERNRLQSHRTPILAFNVLLPATIRLVGPEVDREAIQTYLDTVFRRMAELGGRHVVFGSGGARRVPDGYSMDSAKEQLHSFLSILRSAAARYGIKACIEFLNRRETNIITSLLEARDYALAINSPWIQVLADFYHLDESDEPLDDIIAAADVLDYVHVADTGRRHPGSGQYPYRQFFQTLQRIDYDGPISVECSWGEDQAAEMKQAATFLREQWAAN